MDYSERFYLTSEHPSSKYGLPVLVDRETGKAFGRGDLVFIEGRAVAAVDIYQELEAAQAD